MNISRTLRHWQFQTLNSSLRRLDLIPSEKRERDNNGENADKMQEGVPPATSLSPTPRMLYILWAEWTTGIGGKKTTSLFTVEERGHGNFWFCGRNVLWTAIINLVWTGLSANVVIDRIYQVYGANSTVTQLIDQFRLDKNNNNLHPLIRIWKLDLLVLTWGLFLVLVW